MNFSHYRALVLAHYRKLYQRDMTKDLPDTWERLLNQHYRSDVRPRDAARGIYETEVKTCECL